MNKQFLTELMEFLENELGDYDLAWDFAIDEDVVTVTVTGTHHTGEVLFRREGGLLEVEIYEDTWMVVVHYDWRVKYFWMVLAPQIWSEVEL